MMRMIALAIALLASGGAYAGDGSVAASMLVEKQRLGDNLASISQQLALTTQTYRNIVQVMGAEKAQALVSAELEKARPKYQREWDKNLAAAYAEYLSENELRSVGEQGKASPYAAKFLAVQSNVGKSMQSRSTPLLTQLVNEALRNAFVQVPGK